MQTLRRPRVSGWQGARGRAVLGLVAALLLTVVTASSAQTQATLEFDPDVGRPGEQVVASGCGYFGSTVTVYWSDESVIGTATVDGDGCFATDVTIPRLARPRLHQPFASDGENGFANTTFFVVRPRLELSDTNGTPGTETEASGCGWALTEARAGQAVARADSDVEFVHRPSGASLGTTGVDQKTGCLSPVTLTIPDGTEAGWGEIEAIQASPGLRADAPFEVLSPLPVFYPLQFFQPLELVPFLAENLSVFGVENTQGIQCYDTSNGLSTCSDNSLPLVKDKLASARIYLRYTNPFSIGPATRPNTPVRYNVRLKGSTDPFQSVVVYGTAKSVLDQLDATIARANFSVYGGGNSNLVIEYFVEVDPFDTITETNESDNRFPASGVAEATFRRTEPLTIEGQRIDYNPSGYTGTRLAQGWAVNGGAGRWFEQLLPVSEVDYTRRSGFLDWTTSLGGGDGQHALIGSLNSQWLGNQAWNLNWSGFSLSLTVDEPDPDHVYGWAPNAGYSGGHADMPVYPHQNGYGVVGIGTDRVPASPTTDNPGGGALIFGHELVHDYDVLHTNTGDSCGSTDGSSTWPYGNSSIQEVGFNPVTGNVYDPAATHDIMSYCPAGGSQQGWIAPFTWQTYYTQHLPRQDNGIQIIRRGDARESRAVEGDETLIVSATVFREPVDGELGPMERVGMGLETSDAATEGEYSVQVRNGGTVLYQSFFDRSFDSEYGEQHSHGDDDPGADFAGPNDSASLDVLVPFDDSATSVVLLRGSTVLDTVTVSPNPPSVSITSPGGGAELDPDGDLVVDWDASDPDGGDLTSTVYYQRTPDGEFALLGPLNQSGTSLTVPVSSLAGADDARVRVVVTDGVNTAEATSGSFYVPPKRPDVGILTPADGDRIPAGGSAVLTGFGNDMEDGDLDGSRLAWSSSIDGDLGVGGELTTDTLSAGTHVITLLATDADGDTRTTTRRLHVAAVDTPEVTPATGGAPITSAPELDPVVAAADFTDGSDGGPYRCTVDHGDGTPTATGTVDDGTCTGPAHTYQLPGSYSVSVQVTDDTGLVGTGVRTLEVTDVAGNEIVRIAGDDRFATAAEISRATFDGPVDEVVIATGLAFPDALSGGPAATVRGAPILLVLPDGTVPDATRAELERLEPDVVTILGGTVAVSDAVADELRRITGVTPTRLQGEDRYATAADIATSTFDPGAPVVTIATGRNFADALSGGPPATLGGGPILLVSDVVPDATADALRTLAPDRIEVLGGTVAVPDAVVEALDTFTDGDVVRRFGEDRYATSARISAATYPDVTRTVYVATGENFADALAGSVSAVSRGAPMLIVRPGEVPSSIADEIERIDPDRIVILGGPVAVSEDAERALAGLLAR